MTARTHIILGEACDIDATAGVITVNGQDYLVDCFEILTGHVGCEDEYMLHLRPVPPIDYTPPD